MFQFFQKKRIYLDYASATPILPEALREVGRISRIYGNPGAIHAEGVEAKKTLQDSRERIALLLGVKARELVFVSGGTEANNLAILGLSRRMLSQGVALKNTHWITTVIEHPSTLECFAEIERLGGIVSHVMPDKYGVVHPEVLSRALREETVFFSIAWANHEIGTMQPLSALAQVIHLHEELNGTKVLFHVDAGQVPLYHASQLHSSGADIVSIDSGKIYGPRGVGIVYISNRAELAPIILGGGQERGLRAGTENISLAAGLATAFEKICLGRTTEAKRVENLRDMLAKGLKKFVPGIVLNGDVSKSLPHILNISIPDISSEYFTLSLDSAGIAVATKSACREGEESLSHVVEALGGPAWRAKNTIRISLGRGTTARDITKTVTEFARLLRK